MTAGIKVFAYSVDVTHKQLSHNKMHISAFCVAAEGLVIAATS